VKDVRKFLGLANYYRRFIKDFTRVARPMNVLTWKDEKWWWEEAQQKAFDELKWVFMTKPVLAAPNLDKVSQKVTYLFCDELNIDSKSL